MKQSYNIDDNTGTDFWRKLISKERLKVKVAYVKKEETQEKIRSGEAKGCIVFKKVTFHLIFDVKMECSRKSRMVANGAMTEMPSGITYSSIVSRDSV